MRKILLPILLSLAPGLSPAANPFWPGLESPKLVTPQWVGEEGVEAVVVLSIDDMTDTGKYETFLRPILDRLQEIDGRAPVSISTLGVDPNNPQLQDLLQEGVSIESHTMDHPCPLLAGGDFEKARTTVMMNVDLLSTIPNTAPVAFRMPCCDSMNAVSPRFFAEILHKTTPAGNFLQADSSVFNLFTPDDPILPGELIAPEGKEGGRFEKYVPHKRGYVSYIKNYPYPYVIGGMSWQIPGTIPSDWEAFNRHGAKNPKTIEDLKAAIDCTVLKQGVFTLVFHPHGWIENTQVVELIDHVVARHGRKVKFLNLREVVERLNRNMLGGQRLRNEDGKASQVQVRDLNEDGFMDVQNRGARKTRTWIPQEQRWKIEDLPEGTPGAISLDLGIRILDLNGDGHRDLLSSTADEFSISLGDGTEGGWKQVVRGTRGERDPKHEIPPFVRADGTHHGTWIRDGWIYVQNEDTAGLPGQVEKWRLADFLKPLPAVDDLPNIKPKSPEEALQSMRTRPELEVQLVAAEPLVMDPVDLAWGPDGKLWVVEMADYPNGMDGKGKSGGRVRFLEDEDGDGRYEKSTLFLEGLNFPTGVMPWRGGVLVAAAPEILFAVDTDGDGRADRQEVLYDGFRPGNPQHRVNGLRWGLDNWIYLANGDSDGTIRSMKTGETVDISGRDLRIRPDEGLLEAQSGETQFGRCRDDWGNWFGNNNSNALWHYVLRDHYLRRNPHVASPAVRQMVPEEKGRLQLYPVSTTVERFNDFDTANMITSACGIGIYRDQWLGGEFYGNTFICEPVHNLVTRQVLQRDGLTFSSRRAEGEEGSEFLASSDNWFRPVTARTGPDGALYIVDMYRHVIEHPEWIPKLWQLRLNLRAGDDKGRIYRIVRRGKDLEKFPRLDQLDSELLVRTLDSSNGELRDMVHMELRRRGPGEVQGATLGQLATSSESAAVRLQALAAMNGQGFLKDGGLGPLMADPSPEVRCQLIRMAESVSATPDLLAALSKLVDDPDLRVRHQLHLSLGNIDGPGAEAVLELAVRNFREEGDHHALLRAGLISSVQPALAARILAEGVDGLPEALVEDLTATAKGSGESVERVEVVRVAAEHRRLGGPPPREIAEQLAGHAEAESLAGDAGRGRALFGSHCAVCHRVQGAGNEVGPDLAALTDLSFASLRTAIVDPNAALEDKYVLHTISPREGEALAGMISAETSTALFLKLADGSERIVLKKDLRELKSSGRSLMPEGFGASLSSQDLADLVRHLQTVRPPPKKIPGNEPGLINAAEDGSFTLPASRAAVYGPRLTYGTQYQMLEFWESDRDFAVWTIECEVAGRYAVKADLACETGVENRFQVIAGAHKVSAVVPQTASWGDFQRTACGTIELRNGRQEIVVRSDGPVNRFLMDLQAVFLTPVE